MALVATLIYMAWYNRIAFWFDPVFLMFGMALVLLMAGFQVAFVFAGVALFFALIADEVGLGVLEMLPYRTYGIMGNVTLMAVPLFIFMGLILEKSKMAEGLLLSMGKLFGSVRGGLSYLCGTCGGNSCSQHRHSRGIGGDDESHCFATHAETRLLSITSKSGSIAASGTLGQLIPPSIVLIILGDQMHLSVGDLFRAAVVPGLLLIVLYVIYILVVSYF